MITALKWLRKFPKTTRYQTRRGL